MFSCIVVYIACVSNTVFLCGLFLGMPFLSGVTQGSANVHEPVCFSGGILCLSCRGSSGASSVAPVHAPSSCSIVSMWPDLLFFFFCHVEELASVDVTRLVSLCACYFPSVLTYPLHLWLFLAFRCLCDCAVATTHFQVRCSRAPAGQRNNVVAAYIWQTWASLLTSYTLQLACHSCLMCAPGWAGKSGMSAALS